MTWQAILVACAMNGACGDNLAEDLSGFESFQECRTAVQLRWQEVKSGRDKERWATLPKGGDFAFEVSQDCVRVDRRKA